jgi:hypothetical protein
MINTGAMPAQHFSGVSHRLRWSRQTDHDFAGAVGLVWLGRNGRRGVEAAVYVPSTEMREQLRLPGTVRLAQLIGDRAGL